ncbi:type III pantothenate kinase [Fluviicola chungangensis]|uniref:Type III pantothenate kinase n=1 Tax=Fluviicola chungangensis TaxID=2597671 RepID=A0A556MP03_9FLAO|nr:type III pantothenate kinase [Fluviicola chungangensis]TSJ41640.1 type III pantothenate kinase [Fluviicola chungangensis]
MEQGIKSIVVDAGNTRIKVGLFQDSNIQEVHAFSNEELDKLKSYLIKHKNIPGIISSVRSDKNTKWIKGLLPNALLFNNQLPVPLINNYESPNTLGIDRLANAVAAANISEKHALVIDVGTCIKYDFVRYPKIYEGGSISPGIELRYRAMNQFTGKLPLIEDRIQGPFLGKNTLDAMRSGVMNGMHLEMVGFIEEYRRLYPELTIFLTGGDSQYFELGNKYGIFADENLTLKGLLIALLHAQTFHSSSI